MHTSTSCAVNLQSSRLNSDLAALICPKQAIRRTSELPRFGAILPRLETRLQTSALYRYDAAIDLERGSHRRHIDRAYALDSEREPMAPNPDRLSSLPRIRRYEHSSGGRLMPMVEGEVNMFSCSLVVFIMLGQCSI